MIERFTEARTSRQRGHLVGTFAFEEVREEESEGGKEEGRKEGRKGKQGREEGRKRSTAESGRERVSD